MYVTHRPPRRRALALAGLLAWGGLLLGQPAGAASFTVTSLGDSATDATTLRGAVAASEASADASDTITITATGTIKLTGAVIAVFNGQNVAGKTLNIQGPGAGALAVSGDNRSGVFHVQDNGTGAVTVNVSGLTVKSGSVSGGEGGGFLVDTGQTLALTGCAVTDNVAEYGGGFYNIGTLSLTDCDVSGNVAYDDNGGGIYNDGVSLTLTGCTVAGNVCAEGYSGGGVYSDSGDTTLTDCAVNGNRSQAGGGVYNDGASLTLTRCDVSDNQTGGGNSSSGGGVYSDSGPLALTDCTVEGNNAEEGGGVYNSGASLTLTRCDVRNNVTSEGGGSSYGGGVYSDGGPLALTDCAVTGNVTDDYGGGVYSDGGDLTMLRCTVAGNNAYYEEGGGIYHDGGDMTLTDCAVTGNATYNYYGGGIYSDGAALTMTRCTVSDNAVLTEYSGGGIYHNSGALLTLTDCTVSGNFASDQGGGVYVTNSPASLTNCTIVGNRSVNEGGGLCIALGTTEAVTLTNCTISGNTVTGSSGTAGSGGGVFFTGGNSSGDTDTCTITGSIVAGNTGPDVVSGAFGGNRPFTSGGSNIIGVDDSAGADGFTGGMNSDQVGTTAAPISPGLGPLQSNGGPTLTEALLPGSPAIDADSSAAPAADQRGVSRPQGARADIGAFERDLTAPVTTPSLSGPSFVNGFYRGPVTVTLTATDASGVAGTFYSVDSGPRQTYTGPFTVSGDFTHFVAFYSVDFDGNAEGPAKSVTFSIDSTPPTTTLTSRAVPGGQEVTLKATDNFSGPGGTFFRVDSGPLQTYSGPFVVTGNYDHLVTAYSMDRAANAEGTAKSLTFSIGAASPPPPPASADTTPPVTAPALSGPSFVGGFYRGPVTVTLTATDASGVAATFYSVDSGPRQTYAGPFTVSGDFQHLVMFYSMDNAGNAEGPAKSVTFGIDATPPTTTLTSRAVSGGREITLTATDNFSGPGGTFYRVDSGPLQTYGGPFVVTGAGQHLVTAYSTDRATNTEGPAKSLAFTN